MPASAGDVGLILGWGRSPGEGNGRRKWQESSILAWKTPWTEELGRLQSIGSQRVRHDLGTKQQQQIVLKISKELYEHQ